MIEWPELPFIDTMMTSMVFYGFDKKLPVQDAKTLIENICKLLDEVPSHAHVGLGEGRKSRGPKFSMLNKWINKGDFENYSYFEGVNYFEKGNIRDCSLAVGVTGNPARRKFEIHFRRDREKPVDIDVLLREVLRYLTPHYGIMFDLTVREGSFWFVGGQRSSGMPDALGRASGEFQQEYLFGKKFTDGYFRDVFTWNYLGRPHLDKMIEGMRFADWINEPLSRKGKLLELKSRGTLSLLDNGCAVWELTRMEVAEVRSKMLKAGLLMVKS